LIWLLVALYGAAVLAAILATVGESQVAFCAMLATGALLGVGITAVMILRG
jgi:hypothetical protein